MSRKNKYQNIADEECKQAVIFERVSSEEQKKGASIDAQLKTVIDYCDNRKFKILDKFSIVESSTRGGRLKFYEMLEFVKAQKHKTAIVVNCVDRLQRGYKECVELDDL
jgi:DNA invertase Pin-like site-specific DNA recombinase